MPQSVEESVSNVYLHAFLGKQALPDPSNPHHVREAMETIVSQTGLSKAEVKRHVIGIIQLMDSWNLIADTIGYEPIGADLPGVTDV